MYQLYLVNHTQQEYCNVCRSNFSQERAHFIIPEGWNGDNDDMEIITEFVFREKLKNRKRYTQVEMWPEPDTEDEDCEEDQEDLQEDLREKITNTKSIQKGNIDEDKENGTIEKNEDESYQEDDLEHIQPLLSLDKKSKLLSKDQLRSTFLI